MMQLQQQQSAVPGKCQLSREGRMLRLLRDGRPLSLADKQMRLADAHVIVELTPAWTRAQMAQCIGEYSDRLNGDSIGRLKIEQLLDQYKNLCNHKLK